MSAYNPKDIEKYWQTRWAERGLYRSRVDHSKPKHYAVTMLPYPSGDLHIGHWSAMTPSDARARFKRMQGYNVLFPMGFDAFGLPAEGAAIKRKLHPGDWTYANMDNMRRQLRSMGAMFDWEREIFSCAPEYYRWTQWFFIQLYKNDLAYRKLSPVDWCPSCNTSLAREQVTGEDRHCERCDTPVTKKELDQWFFRITNYAEELLQFGHEMDWPDNIRTMQTNWIGKSQGAQVTFHSESGQPLTVFTTRPDTLWGVTFMVLAPEHSLVASLTTPEQAEALEVYIKQAVRQTEIERQATNRAKTGVFTGSYAVNPVNGAKVPIYVADYVLASYGTGAIMAVPAHDQRDFEFARTFGLPIVPVVQPADLPDLTAEPLTAAVLGRGQLINSGVLTGTPTADAFDAAIAHITAAGYGKSAMQYRLRDWLISRQRYWGAPIPIIHCAQCGDVPVPNDQLPLTLPNDEFVEWLPTGESPLKLHPTWRYTTCPCCGQPAERDTDTLDTFMCSSWYHLRYLSPHYDTAPFDPSEYDYWMPVDTYTGGAEHATMHLLYTRFFHKAFRDLGLTRGPEPMLQLRNQGQILGPNGIRMSKSRGNVVDPDTQVAKYGADTVRAFLMFGYRWHEGGPWSDKNILGVQRWLQRLWDLGSEVGLNHGGTPNPSLDVPLRRKVHQTIQRVTYDLENFEFNTIISALMELTNVLIEHKQKPVGQAVWHEAFKTLLLLCAPVTPHIAEALWVDNQQPESIHQQAWPVVDEQALVKTEIELVLQHNGKLRAKMTVPADLPEADIKAQAVDHSEVQKYLAGRTPKQVIYVPGRLVNVVG